MAKQENPRRRRRRKNWYHNNPGTGATVGIAVAASAVTVGLIAMVMQNRKNMALRMCNQIGGLVA